MPSFCLNKFSISRLAYSLISSFNIRLRYFGRAYQMVLTLVDGMRLFSESFTHFYISLVVDTSREVYFSRFAVSPHCLVETTAGGSGLILYSMDVRAKQRLSYQRVFLPLACVAAVSPHVISAVGHFSFFRDSFFLKTCNLSLFRFQCYL